MRKQRVILEYCGRKYGIPDYLIGFAVGVVLSFVAFMAMYGRMKICIVLSVIAGIAFSRAYVKGQIERRKKQFVNQFCDYLDSLAGALSCGKNTYDSFLCANDDMHELFNSSSPICFESQNFVRGLHNGRGVEELLYEMGHNSMCEETEIFADVYSMCNKYGGDLREVVIETKNTLFEKIAIEAEISTSLAGPKNELNIMAAMPFVITACMRFFKVGASDGNFIFLNLFITFVFLFSYCVGLKIVNIKV